MDRIEMEETFMEAMRTLLHSWGSDTPPEAIWAANGFLLFFKEFKGKTLEIEFEEDDCGNNNSNVLTEMEKWI